MRKVKATGITRRIDDLGRIVIPKELRKTLGIEPGTPIEIYTEEDTIILKKFENRCVLCGSTADVAEIKGKKVCNSCIEELKQL